MELEIYLFEKRGNSFRFPPASTRFPLTAVTVLAFLRQYLGSQSLKRA